MPEPSPPITRERFATAALSCRERLWAYAVQLTRDRSEAEDLLQLTYVRGFEHWDSVRDLESLPAWLLRTMHRAFVDQCRRRTRFPTATLETMDSEGLATTTSHQAARTEARDAVAKGLGDLAPALAQALTLCDVWGFSYEEIAELMECPLGTVRSRIARARAQMLSWLREGSAPNVAAVEPSGRVA